MTSVSCFECSNKDSILCSICGIAKDGAREHFNQKPITNADRIRAMTDEKLAEFLERKTPLYRCKECKWESCKDCCLDWLKKEARTND